MTSSASETTFIRTTFSLLTLTLILNSCGGHQDPAAETPSSAFQAKAETKEQASTPLEKTTDPGSNEATDSAQHAAANAPVTLIAPSPQALGVTSQEAEQRETTPLYRKGSSTPDDFLKRFFEVAAEVPNKRAKQALAKVLSDPSSFHFQLIVTEVDPKTHALTPHEYRVDLDYLYPASAVKTFASLASLMYFEELSHKHSWIDRQDPLSFNAKRCEHKDKTNLQSGLMTLEHEIKQTQLVSSNRAFNHVFDIVGSERLHEYLLPLFPSLRVYHRLSTNETHEESLRVPPLTICDLQRNKVNTKKRHSLRETYTILSDENAPSLNNREPYTGYGDSRESLEVGSAYIDAKTKQHVEKPMDFTWKNRVSLYDFQRLMYAIYSPKKTHQAFGTSISLQEGHKLHDEDLNMLRQAMIIYPHDSNNPKYEGAGLSETRFKPLIRGVRLSDQNVDAQGEGKGVVADQNLYYMNKAGKALGFHLDNALIAVGPSKVQLNKDYTMKKMTRALYVTVGLYVNQDGVLNNNKYEYSKVSVPLFDAIGYAVGRYLQSKFPSKTSINKIAH